MTFFNARRDVPALCVVGGLIALGTWWVKHSDSPQKVGPELCRTIVNRVFENKLGVLADDMAVTQSADGSYLIGGMLVPSEGRPVPVSCSMARVNGVWTAHLNDR